MAVIRFSLTFRIFLATLLLIGTISTFMMLRANDKSYVNKLEPPSNEYKLPIDAISPSLRIFSEDARQSNEDVERSERNPKIIPKRRSLVIFGDDRSGTTLLTRMFSEDTNIFSVYEPLWITRQWRATERDRDHVGDVTDVVGALMSCHFVDNPTAMKFLAHTSEKWAPGLFKNPFQSLQYVTELRRENELAQVLKRCQGWLKKPVHAIISTVSPKSPLFACQRGSYQTSSQG